MRMSALSLAISLLMVAPVMAESMPSPAACEKVETCGSPNCCAHCGRQACCDRYCKVVPYEKEVKKTVWVVKCEEFCAPLPGCVRRPCGNCGECAACTAEPQGCAKCESSCDVCAVEREKRQVPPKCGPVRCRKVLEKKEVVCKVPSYKCVVAYGCASCGDSGAAPAAPSPVMPKPAPSPKKLPPPPKKADIAPWPSVVGASEAH